VRGGREKGEEGRKKIREKNDKNIYQK